MRSSRQYAGAVSVSTEPAGLDSLPFFAVERRCRKQQRPPETSFEQAVFQIFMDVKQTAVIKQEVDFVVRGDILHSAVDDGKALAVC